MKKKGIVVAVLLLIAFVLPYIITNSYFISILVTTLMYAYLATAWNIVSGFAGQMCMGATLFYALGAYIVAVLFANYGVNPWLAFLIAAVVVGILSIPIGLITFPLSGTYYSLATIALLNILRIFMNETQYICGVDFGAGLGIRAPWIGGFANIQFMEKTSYYYLIFAMLIVALTVCELLNRSKPGYYYKAIQTNQGAAASMGVNVVFYKLQAQFITAFLMALGGGFYFMYTMYIEPRGMFSFSTALYVVIVSIVGGRGRTYGPLLGAVILMPLYELLRFYFGASLPGLPAVIFGLILILAIQFMPDGLLATFEGLHGKRIRSMELREKEAKSNG